MKLTDLISGKNSELDQYKKENAKIAVGIIDDALNNQDTNGEWFYTTAVIDTVYQLGIITLNERAKYRALADDKEKANKIKREEKKKYK